MGPTPKKPKQHDSSYGRGTYDESQMDSYRPSRQSMGSVPMSHMSDLRESSGKFQIRLGGDGRYTSGDNIQKNYKRSTTKDSNDGEIYESKRESRISRKRQGGAESEFNEKLADVVDMCVLHDKSRLFH